MKGIWTYCSYVAATVASSPRCRRTTQHQTPPALLLTWTSDFDQSQYPGSTAAPSKARPNNEIQWEKTAQVYNGVYPRPFKQFKMCDSLGPFLHRAGMNLRLGTQWHSSSLLQLPRSGQSRNKIPLLFGVVCFAKTSFKIFEGLNFKKKLHVNQSSWDAFRSVCDLIRPAQPVSSRISNPAGSAKASWSIHTRHRLTTKCPNHPKHSLAQLWRTDSKYKTVGMVLGISTGYSLYYSLY